MKKRQGTQLRATRHAEQRLKERMGISGKRQVKEVVQLAYATGLCYKKHYIPKETFKFINRKVDEKYFGRAKNWRIYNNYLFLFAKDQALITIYELPKSARVKEVRWK